MTPWLLPHGCAKNRSSFTVILHNYFCLLKILLLLCCFVVLWKRIMLIVIVLVIEKGPIDRQVKAIYLLLPCSNVISWFYNELVGRVALEEHWENLYVKSKVVGHKKQVKERNIRILWWGVLKGLELRSHNPNLGRCLWVGWLVSFSFSTQPALQDCSYMTNMGICNFTSHFKLPRFRMQI